MHYVMALTNAVITFYHFSRERKMSNLFPSCAKMIAIDPSEAWSIPDALIQKISRFTAQHYHIENTSDFIETVIKPHQMGDIIVFTGSADELVGFTRIYIQKLQLKGLPITIYSSNTYDNQTHNTNFAAARLVLISTMKYKLSHPAEELVHFSPTNRASKYRFLAELVNNIYPKPNIGLPRHILRLANVLKENNNWPSSPAHPLLVGGQLLKKHQPALETPMDDPLSNYFLSINPDAAKGLSLLVCIPLNLGNIGYGIKQLLTQATTDNLNHLTIENVDV